MPEKNVSQPLLFGKGMNREWGTQLVDGSARLIENWEPQPDGGLRTRRKWDPVDDTGIPTTPHRVLAAGAAPLRAGFETPIRRQRKKQQRRGSAIGHIDLAWDMPTIPESLLLCVLSYSIWEDDGSWTSTATVNVTPPAGWTSVGVVHSPDVSVSLRIYKIEGASARQGEERFSFSQNVKRVQGELLEWRGVEDANAQDKYKSNSGNSTTPDTDFSTATDSNFPNQLVVAAIAARTYDDSIKPSDFRGVGEWFEFKDDLDPPHRSVGRKDYWLNTVVARQNILQPNAQRFQATYDKTQEEDDAKSQWTAILVTFKARAISNSGQHVLLDYQVDNNTHAIYIKDPDLLGDNTAWESIGTVDAEDANAELPNSRLAFTSGPSGVLISSADITLAEKGLVLWQGEDLIVVNRSPRARALTTWKGRYWAAGTKAHPNRLYWSAVGDGTHWNLDEWYADIGDGDWVTDICPVNGGLLVAKKSGLHLVLGSVSSLSQVPLEAGTGTDGRCIVPVPGGAVVLSQSNIWLWQGGVPKILSRALDDWWTGVDHDWATGAFVNGKLYVAGGFEDTVCVYDLVSEAWYVDRPPVDLHVVMDWEGRLLAGFCGNHVTELGWFRSENSPRERDSAVDQTFIARTQPLMLGTPGRPITPKHLYIAYDKHAYAKGHPDVKVTPYYDGVAQTPRYIKEVQPRSHTRKGEGSHRLRLDVGVRAASTCHKVEFEFEYNAISSNDTTFDLEYLEFIYDQEELRP